LRAIGRHFNCVPIVGLFHLHSRFVSLNLQKHAADREDKHRRASNKQAQMLSKIPTRGIMGDEHHIPAKFAPLSCGPRKRR
jgi:hypothetical protein